MSNVISPETVEAAYELLRTTSPFRRWKLPLADEITIEITNSKTLWGSMHCALGDHLLRVTRHQTLPKLIETIAHEMCHLHEFKMTKDCKHGRVWKKLADQVCRAHGFDRETF